MAVTGRGLTFEGAQDMTLGQLVDYCVTWNETNDVEEGNKKHTAKKRKASQADWDALLG